MPEHFPTERVKVTLGDGVERTLRYPIAAMKEAREEFGGSITSIETLNKIDETNIGKLLWYGLRQDQPDITVEQIEALIEPPMMKHIMGQYHKAISASLPEPKNEQSPAMIEELKAIVSRAEAILEDLKSTGLSSGALAPPDTDSDSPTPSSGTSHSGKSTHSRIVSMTA